MHFAQAVFGMQYAHVHEMQDSNDPHLTNCAAHCTVYLNMFDLPFSVRIVCHNILFLFIVFIISFLNRFLTGLPKVNMKLQLQHMLMCIYNVTYF